MKYVIVPSSAGTVQVVYSPSLGLVLCKHPKTVRSLHPECARRTSKVKKVTLLVFDLFNKETERIVNLYKGLPLAERLQRIDHIQARRFSKLTGMASEIATEGIIRHLAACDRMDVNPDISAVREIIDDALNGRRVYAEAAEITRAA